MLFWEDIVILLFSFVDITTAQLHSTNPDLRFCPGSNPAHGVSEIRDGWWGSLTMIPAANKAKRHFSINRNTKTIHDHHHYQDNGVVLLNSKDYTTSVGNLFKDTKKLKVILRYRKWRPYSVISAHYISIMS